MLQENVQRIADAADLTSIASNVVEDRSLETGVARAAEIDVDEAELPAL